MKTAKVLQFCMFVLLVLVFPMRGFSQEEGTCAEKLKSAQSSFEKGQIDQVPLLISKCLKSGGFKREEELTAYKLLIQTFLLNDKTEGADSAMFAFLKSYPEYQVSPTDHSSFVYLFNTYKVKPVVRIGLHAGISKPFLTFPNELPVDGVGKNSKFSSKASNLFFAADARFTITSKIELGLEIGYSQLSFTNDVQIKNLDGEVFSVTSYTETQQRLQIPITMTYDFARIGKSFIPYLRAGAGAAYNFSTKAEVTSTPTDPINLSGTRTGETLNRIDSRVPLDVFGQVGLGIKFKVPKGVIFAELRSDIGTMNQNVAGGKTVEKLEWYFWADPGFRMNSVNLQLGYTFILYKPQKKSE